jgi:HSP20 family molecular chaperone IbpA
MTTTMTEPKAKASEMTESTANTDDRNELSTREEGRFLTPPVDIFETDAGLEVLVDMPGVSRDDVRLGVEDGILTIEGAPSWSASGDSVYEEFQLGRYHRRFRLTDAVDTDRIGAELKHGVLRISLPKSARMRPRKIDVRVG